MLECVIVGGGIHGTYLVQRLLEETSLNRDRIAVVDPHERLLESFRRKAAACDMEELRSTFVHHVGTEPFGLESFAESQGRENELRPTPGYPRRPSLALFLDYADYVIDGNDLESLHRRASVERIRSVPGEAEGSNTLVLETDDGDLRTRNCVLAIGHGGRYRTPDWADGVPGVNHVWSDDFDPERRVGETVIVGGGITAGQLATCLAERGSGRTGTGSATPRESVTMLARHPFERAVTEADPRWINWGHVETNLHCHPPGSRARYEAVQSVRNDSTMPPYLHDRLEDLVETDDLAVRQSAVDSARCVDSGSSANAGEKQVRLLLEDGGCLSADRVVLATGFEPVYEHPFVKRLVAELDLERGYRGMPVLEDESLAWRRTDGTTSPLFVSGALAAGTVGALAGNIAGARRSADRITDAIEAGALEAAECPP
ncbi:FAD/NAD(P)-binding protein [Halostagnicola bangensis]